MAIPIVTSQQQAALNACVEGRNVCITGGAGTGKTFLLKRITDAFNKIERSFEVVAPTGVAAVEAGGRTIHSFSGFGLCNQDDDEVAEKCRRRYMREKWQTPTALIIDEISMVSPKLLRFIELVARHARDDPRTFGGMQVIMIGDFYQLPPVERGKPDPTKPRYAFQSTTWRLLNPDVHILTQPFRQKDQTFFNLLNRVRKGEPTPADIAVLRSRVLEPSTQVVELHTHRAETSQINQREVSRLQTPMRVYPSYRCMYRMNVRKNNSENREPEPKEIFRADEVPHAKRKDFEKAWEALERNGPVGKEVHIKTGMRVMIRKNISFQAGLVNGTCGTVVQMNSDHVIVNVDQDDGLPPKACKVTYMAWKTRLGRGLFAVFLQIPLVPAYAITVHKSQGQTMTAAYIHMGRSFADGQAYVALSRCKDINHMYLTYFPDNCIRADPIVGSFYNQYTVSEADDQDEDGDSIMTNSIIGDEKEE